MHKGKGKDYKKMDKGYKKKMEKAKDAIKAAKEDKRPDWLKKLKPLKGGKK